MAIHDRDFTGNLPKMLAAKLKFEALKMHFWGKWAVFNAPGDRVTVDKNNVPVTKQSPIVMQHELEKSQGDRLMIPVMRNLVNLPTVGMDQLKGHEELQKMNFAQVPIDIVRHAVKPQEGIMSTQTSKDYGLLTNAKPQLLRHYAEVEEYLGATYAFYYGYSWNVLNSSRWTGNSVNVSANSHPHVFVAGHGKVSSTGVYPGTAGYETIIGTAITAMDDTNVFDTNFLSGLKASQDIAYIDPLISKDGNQFRLIVAHPYQIATLEADTKFTSISATANAIQMAKDNPMLTGVKYFWAGFAIFSSDTAVWPVTVSGGDPVWGPSTITNMTSFKTYSTYTKFAAIILGNNALFKAMGQKHQFKKRVDDYDEIIGIAMRAVEGYSRGDFFNEDDGTRGDALINHGSAVLVTYADAPGF